VFYFAKSAPKVSLGLEFCVFAVNLNHWTKTVRLALGKIKLHRLGCNM